jgi:hypothetical protein
MDPSVPLDPQMTTSQSVAPEAMAQSMVGSHPTPTKGRGKGRAANTNAAGVDRDGPDGVGG